VRRAAIKMPCRGGGPGHRPALADCHLGLGRLYLRIGRRHEAGEHLRIGRQMYREMDMRFWLEQAEAEMKELS